MTVKTINRTIAKLKEDGLIDTYREKLPWIWHNIRERRKKLLIMCHDMNKRGSCNKILSNIVLT